MVGRKLCMLGSTAGNAAASLQVTTDFFRRPEYPD